MSEKNFIRNQLIKNMFLTFVVFSIILTVFSVFIYGQINATLYKNVDHELIMSSKNIKVQGEVIKKEMSKMSGLNPKYIYILRNLNGDIINPESLGRFYNEYINEVVFNTEELGTINNFIIGDNYNYRGITFKMISLNEVDGYLQVLVNVDSEVESINNIKTILFLGTIVIILFSIIASYFISKKTIKPIVNSWKKQTEFVQNASHELRTPLTIIQAKQELLLQEPESKIIDKTEEITLTLKETKRLTRLIKDLMVLARADANQYDINKESINIDQLLSKIVIPYKELAEFEGKEMVLNLNYINNISIDVNKINQLIIILLDNALRYTEKGDKIEINTCLRDGKCVIEVKDTGIGIDEETSKRMFERFYRADKARTREKGGTGLGLSIAHWIVKLHNGSIKANPNNPKGTIITIKI